MSFINYNGLIYTDDEAILLNSNHAFRYGEGLIETMLWHNHTISLSVLHFNRLQRGLKILAMKLSWTYADLVSESMKVIQANNNPNEGVVRLQVFRDREEQCGFLLEYLPLDKAINDRRWAGSKVGIVQDVIKSADLISGLKTTSRLTYIIAKKAAGHHGWNDALLVNQYGRIVESTIANIFCITGNTLITPPLSEGCVAGIFRQYLMDTVLPGNMVIEERALTIEELEQADEVFLTNAVRGIQPVQVIGNKVYTHELTRLIFEATKLK